MNTIYSSLMYGNKPYGIQSLHISMKNYVIDFFCYFIKTLSYSIRHFSFYYFVNINKFKMVSKLDW